MIHKATEYICAHGHNLITGNHEIVGQGNRELKFNHPTDMVARKSSYICPRTLMIKSNKSASDLDREFIKRLKNSKSTISIVIVVEA